jgi:hypothetical protein
MRERAQGELVAGRVAIAEIKRERCGSQRLTASFAVSRSTIRP